jgi:hypothetical protein
MKKKLEVVQIIENNPITGIKYGTVEIAENVTDINKKVTNAKHAFTTARMAQTKRVHKNRTKSK